MTRVALDLNTIDGYRTFLKVKALPTYRFVGRDAYVPDEYASLLGTAGAADPLAYKPHPGLFDYQRDISRLAIRKRKFAVFMEPGRGKTLIDFEFAHAALAATGRRVLIVSPLMVVRQMIEEHRTFYPGRGAPPITSAPRAWRNGSAGKGRASRSRTTSRSARAYRKGTSPPSSSPNRPC